MKDLRGPLIILESDFYKIDWEFVQVLDNIGYHDKEIEVCGFFKNVELSATAMMSCGEIIEVFYDSIEVK